MDVLCKSLNKDENIPLADDDPQVIVQEKNETAPEKENKQNDLSASSTLPFTEENYDSLNSDVNADEMEEKARLIFQVLELQNTLDGKLVSARWANLRDAWMRACKNEVQKSGAGAKTFKPYIYKEQMQFLKKIAEPNRTHDSVSERPTDAHSEANKSFDTNPEESLPSYRKKKKLTDLDEKMCQFLDSRISTHQGDHPMLSFFKGILPSVMSFGDDETLEFQSGVLSLAQNIKKKRENRLYSSNYGWQPQSRDYMRSEYSSQSQNNPPGNQNTLQSGGYGYWTRHSVEPPSPASTWSQPSTSQDSELDFDNF